MANTITTDLHARVIANIKAYRALRNLTQQQLADRLHVSQPAIAQLESGATVPTLTRITEVAAALGVTPDDLLGNTPRKFSENSGIGIAAD